MGNYSFEYFKFGNNRIRSASYNKQFGWRVENGQEARKEQWAREYCKNLRKM